MTDQISNNCGDVSSRWIVNPSRKSFSNRRRIQADIRDWELEPHKPIASLYILVCYLPTGWGWQWLDLNSIGCRFKYKPRLTWTNLSRQWSGRDLFLKAACLAQSFIWSTQLDWQEITSDIHIYKLLSRKEALTSCSTISILGGKLLNVLQVTTWICSVCVWRSHESIFLWLNSPLFVC